ncbi:phage tail family protein [Clostridium sp. 001]|uniref:phage tail family protein n=1 Tax=Clostridium sp. 001 TaxID=1970093 RepID=UPI001C2BFBF0|nr:phage tail family protein [Clostridium sp. 001]QXE20003.1 phage tail protein [Clostridium sp. 001]
MQNLIFTNERGQSIKLKNSGPFLLQKFDPDPPKTTMLTTKAPGQDGKTVQGVLLDERVLSIQVAVLGDNSQDMFVRKKQLNSAFNPKLEGTLFYSNGSGEYIIKCRVNSVTPKDRHEPVQQFLIQLDCFNPFWMDVQESKEEIALWVGDFHFPLIIPPDGITMGHRISNLIVNVCNKGDVECGMRIEFTALATVVNPSLFNVYTRKFIKVRRTLQAGDKLNINTSFANKRVEIVKSNGTVTNVFNWIDLQTTFLQLAVGDNLLRYDAEKGLDNLEMAVYYRPLYVGV